MKLNGKSDSMNWNRGILRKIKNFCYWLTTGFFYLLTFDFRVEIMVYLLYILMGYTSKIPGPHIYIEGFLEVAIESWPEWDLNPRPLNSVQTL